MSETLHATRFPGESDEYRRERDRLLEHELRLRREIEAVAAERRALPLGGEVPVDYAFDPRAACPSCSRRTRTRCCSTASCSSRRTEIRSASPARRARRSSTRSTAPRRTSNSASTSPSSRRPRSSSSGRTRTRAAGATSACSPPRGRRTTATTTPRLRTPGDSSRSRRSSCAATGPSIHSWSSELMYAPREPDMHPRHVDFMWPIWSVFDLTPEGRGTDWNPELEYS